MTVDIRPDDLAAFIAAARVAVDRGGLLTMHVDGSSCRLDGDLATAVVEFLELASSGRAVEMAALPEEITTGQAADLLGVSRPTVVALVDSGKLPASRTRTHRRLRTADVLAYRAQVREQKRAALRELAEVSEDLGMYE